MNRKSIWYRLFWWLFLLVAGIIVTYIMTIIVLLLIRGDNLMTILSQLGTQVSEIRLMQTFQSIFVFILPPFLLMVIYKEKASEFLNLKAITWQDSLVAIISIIVMIPLINILVAWNEGWCLPARLAGLEEWMQMQEARAADVTEKMLSDLSISGIFINFLLIAVMAGFGEELSFRGLLQHILGSTFKGKSTEPLYNRENPTPRSRRAVILAIWLSALLFSAIHLQFYGLVNFDE